MTWNRRILIVDDYPDIHLIIKTALEVDLDLFDSVKEIEIQDSHEFPYSSEDYEIDSAYSGQEAYEKVVEARKSMKPYALILMDMRMPPGLNGLETTKKVFEIDSNIEVIIMTAYSDYSAEEIFAQIGNSAHLNYLRKPFELEKLKSLIKTLVKKWNVQEGK